MKDKTLLIHTDTKTDKTTALIVDEQDIVKKTKELLKKLAKKSQEAKIDMYKHIGVVLKSADKQDRYAVAYEREQYVIVAQNGTAETARLYGNWDEAISYVHKFLHGDCTEQEKSSFLIDEYIIHNK